MTDADQAPPEGMKPGAVVSWCPVHNGPLSDHVGDYCPATAPPEGERALNSVQAHAAIAKLPSLAARGTLYDAISREAVLRILARVAPAPPTTCEACDQPARYCGNTHVYHPEAAPPAAAGLDGPLVTARKLIEAAADALPPDAVGAGSPQFCLGLALKAIEAAAVEVSRSAPEWKACRTCDGRGCPDCGPTPRGPAGGKAETDVSTQRRVQPEEAVVPTPAGAAPGPEPSDNGPSNAEIRQHFERLPMATHAVERQMVGVLLDRLAADHVAPAALDELIQTMRVISHRPDHWPNHFTPDLAERVIAALRARPGEKKP